MLSCRISSFFSDFSELFWFPPSPPEPAILTPICCCCCCIRLCCRSWDVCNWRSHWTWQCTWLSLQRSVVQLPLSSLTLSSLWEFWFCPACALFWTFWWFCIWWWDCCWCWCNCCCCCWDCICCCIWACAACKWLAGIWLPSRFKPGRETGICKSKNTIISLFVNTVV